MEDQTTSKHPRNAMMSVRETAAQTFTFRFKESDSSTVVRGRKEQLFPGKKAHPT